MGTKLILYSTDHCSLCEQALGLLLSMTELAGKTVRVVDVAGDDDLFAEFAEAIPVLEIRREDGATQRLDWPFDSKIILSSIRQIE